MEFLQHLPEAQKYDGLGALSLSEVDLQMMSYLKLHRSAR